MSNRGATALVLVSGGLDSAACAQFLRACDYKVQGLHVDYGHMARLAERKAVERISRSLHLPVAVCTVDPGRRSGAGEIGGRNGFLIMTALLCAPPRTTAIALGLHKGTPYYDCSPLFLQRMKVLVEEYTDGMTSVLAPFVNWSKRDIYEYSLKMRVPMEWTYSCEVGAEPPCGTCSSCTDRGLLAHAG